MTWMWVAIAALTIAVVGEGAALVQLYGRIPEPGGQRSGGPPPPGTPPAGGPPPTSAQGDTLRIIRDQWDAQLELQMAAEMVYTLDGIELVGGGQAPWLVEFYAAHAVSTEDASTVNAVLAEYMMRVNEIRLQEVRGAHTPRNSAKFYKVEHERMIRTLIIVLGSDGTAALEPILDEQGLQRH